MDIDIYEALQDPVVRYEAMRNNFPLFCAYYFGWEFTEFQIKWMLSLQGDLNTFIEGFRASRKTTIVKIYILWCVLYKKYSYIVWQSYENTASTSNVTDIAKMLFVPEIIRDYGTLYPLGSSLEEFSKKTQGNFDTNNKVRVQSRSIKQNARGLNEFDQQSGQTERPDLLIIDDVDVNDSVENVFIIDKNERKILGELFGALNPLRHKIIILGNTIKEDGIIPRFRKIFKDDKMWDIFWQPLFEGGDEYTGTNVRPEEFTPEVIANVKGHGIIAFKQNYLLIPSSSGTGIFIRDYFAYFLTSHFESELSPLKKTDVNWVIFIDPAFSTSKKSDDRVAFLLGWHKITKHFYLLDGYVGKNAGSVTREGIIKMYNRALLGGYKIDYIHCEEVSINPDQTQFIKDLKSDMLIHEINCPLYTSKPMGNKHSRIEDTLEPVLSLNGMSFNRNIDSKILHELEKQLLEHPNSGHDDHSDCLTQGVFVFKNKGFGNIGINGPNREKKPRKVFDVDSGTFKIIYI